MDTHSCCCYILLHTWALPLILFEGCHLLERTDCPFSASSTKLHLAYVGVFTLGRESCINWQETILHGIYNRSLVGRKESESSKTCMTHPLSKGTDLVTYGIDWSQWCLVFTTTFPWLDLSMQTLLHQLLPAQYKTQEKQPPTWLQCIDRVPNSPYSTCSSLTVLSAHCMSMFCGTI